MVAKPGPEGAGNLQEERESLCPGGAGYIRGWGGVGDREAGGGGGSGLSHKQPGFCPHQAPPYMSHRP